MRADALIAQIITDKGKLLLYGARCQGKHQFIAAYPVAQTEVFNILIDNKGNSENTLFPCFLLVRRQPLALLGDKKALAMDKKETPR